MGAAFPQMMLPVLLGAFFFSVTTAHGVPMGSEYPNDDGLRCKVGLSLGGFDDTLDGDYMMFLKASRSGLGPKPSNTTNLRLAYTTELYYNQSEAGGNSYGCYEFGGWGKPGGCSKADIELTKQKWAIFEVPNRISSAPAKVRAVCETGCPQWTPNCIDLFTVGEPKPGASPYPCPLWPETWHEETTWRILDKTGGTTKNVTITPRCCLRKTQYCDACMPNTCPSLKGLLHDNCPPNKGSVFHPQSKLQATCCKHFSHEPLGQVTCGCDGSKVPTVCVH